MQQFELSPESFNLALIGILLNLSIFQNPEHLLHIIESLGQVLDDTFHLFDGLCNRRRGSLLDRWTGLEALGRWLRWARLVVALTTGLKPFAGGRTAVRWTVLAPRHFLSYLLPWSRSGINRWLRAHFVVRF